MKAANPYLIFNGNAEEAFAFYKSVFGGEYLQVLTFSDMQGMDNLPEAARDKIAHVALPVGNEDILMGSDTPAVEHAATFGDNVFITVEAESGGEAETLFAALSAGGDIRMPLEKTEWAEKYGMCTDKFGVGWMVNYTGDQQA